MPARRSRTNLRVIKSTLNPVYKAKNDTVEFNADYAVTPALTLTSQTGYNQRFSLVNRRLQPIQQRAGRLYSVSGRKLQHHLLIDAVTPDPAAGTNGDSAGCRHILRSPTGLQRSAVGCKILSDEHAWQLSQEFRLASNFSGPFNFSVGGNYLHYETEENYYVFINTLTIISMLRCHEGRLGSRCQRQQRSAYSGGLRTAKPFNRARSPDILSPISIPIQSASLNNQGHNYFLSQNPYTLNSYAAFGEAYYNIASDLKLTAGLRWTEDRKHFTRNSQRVARTWLWISDRRHSKSAMGSVNWATAVNWTPKLDFTDQTLVYGSYAHGYKAGGANPPGAIFPQTFSALLGLPTRSIR